jgi:hypothetical protein
LRWPLQFFCGQEPSATEIQQIEKFQAAIAAKRLGHTAGDPYSYLVDHVQNMIDLMRRNPDAMCKGRRMIELLSDDAQFLDAETQGDEYIDGVFRTDERLVKAVQLELNSN